MTNIGRNIKNVRKQLGLTQEELAEKINVTRQAVSNWENGKTEPDLETISGIAEVFKIDSYELINNKSIPKTDEYKKNKFFPYAVIFGVLTIIGFIASLFLEKPAMIARNEYYDGTLFLILNCLIKPLTGFFFGMCFSLFTKIATGFYLKNKIIRLFVFISGVVAIILTTCFAIHFFLVFTFDLPFRLSFSAVFLYYQQEIVLGNSIVHTLSPPLLFYGSIKK